MLVAVGLTGFDYRARHFVLYLIHKPSLSAIDSASIMTKLTVFDPPYWTRPNRGLPSATTVLKSKQLSDVLAGLDGLDLP